MSRTNMAVALSLVCDIKVRSNPAPDHHVVRLEPHQTFRTYHAEVPSALRPPLNGTHQITVFPEIPFPRSR